MRNFIKSKLVNNAFRCNMYFKFENKEDVNISVIIDTGCTSSHISADLIYIFMSDEERLDTKQKYMEIRNKVLGRGIESFNKDINTELSISNTNVVIQQKMYNCIINGVHIGNKLLNVSYDTSQAALIGMSILKDWDIHIGKNKNNDIILLACPYENINQEYLKELESEFNLISASNAAIINKKYKFSLGGLKICQVSL